MREFPAEAFLVDRFEAAGARFSVHLVDEMRRLVPETPSASGAGSTLAGRSMPNVPPVGLHDEWLA